MKYVHYDPEADILYIVVKDGPVEDTYDIDEDDFIEVNEKGEVVSIEIWNASKNVIESIASALVEKIKQ